MSRQSKYVVLVHSVDEDGKPCLVHVEVKAQYHRIVEGALVFRNYVPNNYPEMVATFAHGQWIEVRRV